LNPFLEQALVELVKVMLSFEIYNLIIVPIFILHMFWILDFGFKVSYRFK